MNSLNRLLELSSQPIYPGSIASLNGSKDSQDFKDLLILSKGIYSKKNGFYTFEGALHTFPIGTVTNPIDLLEWNTFESWKSAYGGFFPEGICFSQDIFGNQFLVRKGRFYFINVETLHSEGLGINLEEWASVILDDFDYYSGYKIAHEWQLKHGPIHPSKRLIPRIPFALGGEYDISNLVDIEMVKGMRIRGGLAKQIRDLPDGAQISYSIPPELG